MDPLAKQVSSLRFGDGVLHESKGRRRAMFHVKQASLDVRHLDGLVGALTLVGGVVAQGFIQSREKAPE